MRATSATQPSDVERQRLAEWAGIRPDVDADVAVELHDAAGTRAEQSRRLLRDQREHLVDRKLARDRGRDAGERLVLAHTPRALLEVVEQLPSLDEGLVPAPLRPVRGPDHGTEDVPDRDRPGERLAHDQTGLIADPDRRGEHVQGVRAVMHGAREEDHRCRGAEQVRAHLAGRDQRSGDRDHDAEIGQHDHEVGDCRDLPAQVISTQRVVECANGAPGLIGNARKLPRPPPPGAPSSACGRSAGS